MEVEQISKEEYLEWKSHKVTKAFLDNVKQQRDMFAGVLFSGNTLKPDSEYKTEHVILKIMTLNDILNIEYETEEERVEYDH